MQNRIHVVQWQKGCLRELCSQLLRRRPNPIPLRDRAPKLLKKYREFYKSNMRLKYRVVFVQGLDKASSRLNRPYSI